MKLGNGKMNCFIPCRKTGDKINKLNFLELEGKKLVEYSILVAQQSNLFKKIFIISDDKTAAMELVEKYPEINFIFEKKTNKTFYKMLIDLNNKKNILTDTICVLLPNFPFKTPKSIKKMYSIYLKKDLSLITSAHKQNKFIYKKKKNIITEINYSEKIKDKNKIPPLFYLSGGIFFYNKKNSNLDFKKFNLDQLYFLNEHEAFGIYSLYDFIKASSLFNIDSSIINKLIGYEVKI